MVIVLSDWSNEDATSILKNLKRHNEWYSIKRKTSQPLIPSIKKGMFKERMTLYKNRMPDMHISDIYYNAFLVNGKKEQHYRDVSPGEKIRLRVINAGASTYFMLNGTYSLRVIAADGVDVVPTKIDQVLIAIAETYDFEISIPENGAYHFQATAQDGSGSTNVFIGQEKNQFAPKIPKPDYFALMKKVAEFHKGGHNSHMVKPYTKIISSTSKTMKTHKSTDDGHKEHSKHMDMSKNKHSKMEPNITTTFDYGFLKSPQSTEISHKKETREVMMNLNANMLRYVWMINGKVLSKDDKILIKKDEKVRFIMNNNTMMHHPMHLHGHFFRVINKNGSHSPLKHTVDIPPFESVTIEFDANEYGDWFFHCHILYHMASGMAKVVSYNTPRDSSLEPFPYDKVLQHDQKFFHWFTAGVASNMGSLTYNAENTFNAFISQLSFGWNNRYEHDFRYERYVNNYTRFNVGVTMDGGNIDPENSDELVGYIGVRNQLLSVLDAGINVDTKLRPELELEWHIGLLNRVQLTGHYEWKNDFSFIGDEDQYTNEHTFNFAVEYTLNKLLNSNLNYDNRYGFGVGLMFLF
ncbi:MAG TPA: copper oxidase [Acholeplasmataceae bacterium]|nr:copper oxidase [Acholeplasmataceae bacterium]